MFWMELELILAVLFLFLLLLVLLLLILLLILLLVLLLLLILMLFMDDYIIVIIQLGMNGNGINKGSWLIVGGGRVAVINVHVDPVQRSAVRDVDVPFSIIIISSTRISSISTHVRIRVHVCIPIHSLLIFYLFAYEYTQGTL